MGGMGGGRRERERRERERARMVLESFAHACSFFFWIGTAGVAVGKAGYWEILAHFLFFSIFHVGMLA